MTAQEVFDALGTTNACLVVENGVRGCLVSTPEPGGAMRSYMDDDVLLEVLTRSAVALRDLPIPYFALRLMSDQDCIDHFGYTFPQSQRLYRLLM